MIKPEETKVSISNVINTTVVITRKGKIKKGLKQLRGKLMQLEGNIKKNYARNRKGKGRTTETKVV